MKKLVVLLMAMLVATSAMAVADDDPDQMGIYFDTNADQNCLTIGSSIPFYAYIILTNPAVPAVSFYEFGYRNEIAPGMLFRLADEPVAGDPGYYAIDLGSGDQFLGDHIVGLDVGLPSQAATVLHRWQLMLLAPVSMDMFIFQSGAPSLPGTFPVFMNDITKELFTAGQSTGGFDIPVAQVNPTGDCVVSVESASFGSVKSLYR